MQKLEIRYNLVREDGLILSDEDSDWTECWLVVYNGLGAVIDSTNKIIEIGAMDVIDEKRWFTLDDMDVQLKNYPQFLRQMTDFVNTRLEEKPVNPAIKVFEMLLEGNFMEPLDMLEVGELMGVPYEYMDSYRKELGDSTVIYQ